jgi:hypothetical protein
MINVQKDHALFMWNDDGELGREGRRKNEILRNGERGREMRWREKMAWVIK